MTNEALIAELEANFADRGYFLPTQCGPIIAALRAADERERELVEAQLTNTDDLAFKRQQKIYAMLSEIAALELRIIAEEHYKEKRAFEYAEAVGRIAGLEVLNRNLKKHMAEQREWRDVRIEELEQELAEKDAKLEKWAKHIIREYNEKSN